MTLQSIIKGGAVALTVSVSATFAAQAQQVYHLGVAGEPATLDPHFASGTWENRIIGDMFMGLLTEAADGQSIAGAAEDWEISDDGLVYTFDLRDGAVWSDGEPVTADDFVYSWQRILAPETAAQYAFILFPIENAEAINAGEADADSLGAEALDADTLQVTLNEPTPYFLDLLTHYTTWPVPQHVVEEHGEDWTDPDNIQVNGPYRLVEWLPQTYVHSARNEMFWDNENVTVDEVYYYPTEDRSAALRRFRAGELDANFDFPSEQIDFLEENLPDSYRIAPYLGIYYYPINVEAEPFDDVNVRAALSMAINRSAITDQVLQTGEIPATSFVPPIEGYEPAMAAYGEMSHDEAVAEAQRLMEEAGYGPDNPLELTLRYNTSDNHRRVAVAVAAMWQDIYVETELFNTDVSVHYADLQEGDFQVARAGWIADYPDPENFLVLLSSMGGDFNYGNWFNDEYDELLRRSYTITDLEERAQVMQEAEQIAMDNYGTIPIYYYVSKNLVAPYVEGWIDNTRDIHRTRWISLNR